jgi:signal peptidase II
MILSRKLRFALLAGVLLCTVGCDQTSKHLARTVLSYERSVVLPGRVVELQLADNPGSFLSVGAVLPNPARFVVFTLGVGIGLTALAAYLTGCARISTARVLSLALVLAGGTGNLLDRVLRDGFVTDFAVIHIGPLHTGVFNVADVLIVSGGAVMVWTFRKSRPSDGPTDLLQRTGR